MIDSVYNRMKLCKIDIIRPPVKLQFRIVRFYCFELIMNSTRIKSMYEKSMIYDTYIFE